MRCFRVNPASEDAARLLTEEGQWTEPWGNSEHGSACEKCQESGHLEHRCWSCMLTGARESCPVCSGRVRWDAECPVCRGSGRVDGAPRRGVSVFPTPEGLYHYMLAKDAEVERRVIVELEADPAEDVDFDADQGAMLAIPKRIVGCTELDPELVERIRRRAA